MPDEPQPPPSGPAPKPSGSPAASDVADQALKAAQAAVTSLKVDAGVDPASAAASPTPVDAAKASAPAGSAPSAQPLDLPAFGPPAASDKAEGIDLLADVNLHVKVELGRTRMLVEDVLRLGQGSVVELDKLAGDPVDVYVNDRRVARGEVLVLNDNFCVRINEIVAQTADQRSVAVKNG